MLHYSSLGRTQAEELRVMLRTATLLVLGSSIAFLAGCGGSPMSNPPNPTPTSSCTPSSTPEFAYSLNIDTTQPYFPPFGYAVSIYSVNSCTGALSATTPTSVATGFAPPQQGAEGMVVDPLGRFAYVANLVSNATNQSTISMFTIDAATGILKPTMPATVPTGFFPQGIAIDPLGRFVYTANSDDDTVSMFTINQTTGVLTPTTPAAVSTYVPSTNAQNSDPVNVTADPSGKFLYVVEGEGTISIFDINQTTGVLTPLHQPLCAPASSPLPSPLRRTASSPTCRTIPQTESGNTPSTPTPASSLRWPQGPLSLQAIPPLP